MCVFRKEIDVEDTNMILMNLDNGVRACYLQCHFAPDIWRNYTFIGTEGRLENVNGGERQDHGVDPEFQHLAGIRSPYL